jgi:hypothetical protein
MFKLGTPEAPSVSGSGQASTQGALAVRSQRGGSAGSGVRRLNRALTQLEQFEPRFHILGEAGSNGIIGLDNA